MSSYVPPEVRLAVLARDKSCLAPQLDQKAGRCMGPLHCDHVRGQPDIGELQITAEGGFGKRPPSDPEHVAVLCAHHHATWATRKASRALLREYLRSVPA